jgi:hypothetical protein
LKKTAGKAGLPLEFFRFEIHHRVAVFHTSDAGGHAGFLIMISAREVFPDPPWATSATFLKVSFIWPTQAPLSIEFSARLADFSLSKHY